ncbi:MAG: STAS/SEC14 domain-containing protein [Deltaproteobacteria bacterium]|nr:STAS/SEC14 domain-containing protein [Deltaproteobacteria bacterium]
MSKVQVASQVEIDIDDLLKGVAQLEPNELEQVVNKLLALQARQRAVSLSKTETDLLEQINQGLPQTVRQRYEELAAKSQEETITPAEHVELLRLTDQIEQADVERPRALIALAELRQVSLDAVMDQLGLRRSSIHA